MVNSLRVLRMFMLAMKSMFNFYPEQIKLSTKSHCALSQYPPPPTSRPIICTEPDVACGDAPGDHPCTHVVCVCCVCLFFLRWLRNGSLLSTYLTV